ncbi:MAG: tryptophan halogenase family protein [Litorimonas sp.]
MTEPIQSIVIVGGGTSGWIAAASLSKYLGKTVNITLVESDAIGTVGVGEATIPQIRKLNGTLGLDEAEFVRATKGSFKLGIEFNDWGRLGESYLHTFGDPGLDLAGLKFHHYWLRAKLSGGSEASLWDYSLHNRAAYAHKFAPLQKVGNTQMGGLSYAYHFDAGLYAKHLRNLAENLGVNRHEGRVVDVILDAETGFIESVKLESGDFIHGDLFIDCSGFRGLLIGDALNVEYEDWSEYLPCNRAVAVACKSTKPLLPYTKSTAREAGWQWRIPLQHRTGNGHVFCDGFTTQDEATDRLVESLDGDIIGSPKQLSFTTGRRRHFWSKNCVSLGLSSGFLEPLESTSIHFVQSHVSRLLEFFPDKNCGSATRAEYNRIVGKEFELVRDFLVLHYKQTKRDDTEFWRHCRDMAVPDSLIHKMELFKETGHIYREIDDIFRESSWAQVMIGQGLMPKSYHRMADKLSPDQLSRFLADVDSLISQTVEPLPTHAEFIAKNVTA